MVGFTVAIPPLDLSRAQARQRGARSGQGFVYIGIPLQPSNASVPMVTMSDNEGHWIASPVRVGLRVDAQDPSAALCGGAGTIPRLEAACAAARLPRSCTDTASPLYGRLRVDFTCDNAAAVSTLSADWSGYTFTASAVPGDCALSISYSHATNLGAATPRAIAALLSKCVSVSIKLDSDSPLSSEFDLRLELKLTEAEDPTVRGSGNIFKKGGSGYGGFPLPNTTYVTSASTPLMRFRSPVFAGLPPYGTASWTAPDGGSATGAGALVLRYGAVNMDGQDVYVGRPIAEGLATLISDILPVSPYSLSLLTSGSVKSVDIQVEGLGCGTGDRLVVSQTALTALGAYVTAPSLGEYSGSSYFDSWGGSWGTTPGPGNSTSGCPIELPSVTGGIQPDRLLAFLAALQIKVDRSNARALAVGPGHHSAAGYRSLRVSVSTSGNSSAAAAGDSGASTGPQLTSTDVYDAELRILVPVAPRNDPPVWPAVTSLAIDEGSPAQLTVIVTSNCSDPALGLDSSTAGRLDGTPQVLCLTDPDPVAVSSAFGPAMSGVAVTADGDLSAAAIGVSSTALTVLQVSHYLVTVTGVRNINPATGTVNVAAIGLWPVDEAPVLDCGSALTRPDGLNTSLQYRRPVPCWKKRYGLFNAAEAFNYENSTHPRAFTLDLSVVDRFSLATDRSGNGYSETVTGSVTVTVTDVPDVPVVTSIRNMPEPGLSVGGGDLVEIWGTGLGVLPVGFVSYGRVDEIEVRLVSGQPSGTTWTMAQCTVLARGTRMQCVTPAGYGFNYSLAVVVQGQGGVFSNVRVSFEPPRPTGVGYTGASAAGAAGLLPSAGIANVSVLNDTDGSVSYSSPGTLVIRGTGLSSAGAATVVGAYQVRLLRGAAISPYALAPRLNTSVPAGSTDLDVTHVLDSCTVDPAGGMLTCTDVPPGAGSDLAVEVLLYGRSSRTPVVYFARPVVTGIAQESSNISSSGDFFVPSWRFNISGTDLGRGPGFDLDWVQYAYIPTAGSIAKASNESARCALWTDKTAPCDLLYARDCVMVVPHAVLSCGLDPRGWGTGMRIRLSVGGQVSDWAPMALGTLAYPAPALFHVETVPDSKDPAAMLPSPDLYAHTSLGTLMAFYSLGVPQRRISSDVDGAGDASVAPSSDVVAAAGVQYRYSYEDTVGLVLGGVRVNCTVVSGLQLSALARQALLASGGSMAALLPLLTGQVSGQYGSLGFSVLYAHAPPGFGVVSANISVGRRYALRDMSYRPLSWTGFALPSVVDGSNSEYTATRKFTLLGTSLSKCAICLASIASPASAVTEQQTRCVGGYSRSSIYSTCAVPERYRTTGLSPTFRVLINSTDAWLYRLEDGSVKDDRVALESTAKEGSGVVTLADDTVPLTFNFASLYTSKPEIVSIPSTAWPTAGGSLVTMTAKNIGPYGSVKVVPLGLSPPAPGPIECPTVWWTVLKTPGNTVLPRYAFETIDGTVAGSILNTALSACAGVSVSGGTSYRLLSDPLLRMCANATFTANKAGHRTVFNRGQKAWTVPPTDAGSWTTWPVLPCYIEEWTGETLGDGHSIVLRTPAWQGAVQVQLLLSDGGESAPYVSTVSYAEPSLSSVVPVGDGRVPTRGGDIVITGSNLGLGPSLGHVWATTGCSWSEGLTMPLSGPNAGENSIVIQYDSITEPADGTRYCLPIPGAWSSTSVRCRAGLGISGSTNHAVVGLATATYRKAVTRVAQVPGTDQMYAVAVPCNISTDPLTDAPVLDRLATAYPSDDNSVCILNRTTDLAYTYATSVQTTFSTFKYASPRATALSAPVKSTDGGYTVTLLGGNLSFIWDPASSSSSSSYGVVPWSTPGPEEGNVYDLWAASVDITAVDGKGLVDGVQLSTAAVFDHYHEHVSFVMPPIEGTVRVTLVLNSKAGKAVTITSDQVDFTADPPVIESIEALQQGEDDDPCLALNVSTAGCIRSARGVRDWGSYPVRASRPCFRAVGSNSNGATQLVIKGRNFGSGNSELQSAIVGDMPCVAVSGGKLWNAPGKLLCRLQKADGTSSMPVGAAPLSLKIAWSNTTSSVSDITPIAVCPCGMYPKYNISSGVGYCTDCEPGASCAGALDVPRALAGWWRTDPQDWLADPPVGRQLASVVDINAINPFVECPVPEMCGPDQTCINGSGKFMCTSCEDQFKRGVDGTCQLCEAGDAWKTMASLAGLGVGVFTFVLVFVLCRSDNSADEPEEEPKSPTGDGGTPKAGQAGAAAVSAKPGCCGRRSGSSSSTGSNATTTDSSGSPVKGSGSGGGAKKPATAKRKLTPEEAAEAALRPAPVPLFKVLLTFAQTMAAISSYAEPRTLKTKPSPHDMMILPDVLRQFKVVGDLGTNLKVLNCTLRMATDWKIYLWMAAPVICLVAVSMLVQVLVCVARTPCYKARFKTTATDAEIQRKGRYISLFLVFIALPAAISALARAQNCAPAAAGFYLVDDPEISCGYAWFVQLKLAARIVGYVYTFIPVLVAAVLLPVRGIPFLSCHCACCGRRMTPGKSGKDKCLSYRVDRRVLANIRERFRFLWEGYARNRGSLPYAWECVVLLRKVLFMGLGTGFLGLQDGRTQCGATSLLLMLSLALHWSVLPYASPAINILEGLSLLSTTVFTVAIFQRLSLQGSVTAVGASTAAASAITPSLAKELQAFEIPALVFAAAFVLLWFLEMADLATSGGNRTLQLLHRWNLDGHSKAIDSHRKLSPQELVQLQELQARQAAADEVAAQRHGKITRARSLRALKATTHGSSGKTQTRTRDLFGPMPIMQASASTLLPVSVAARLPDASSHRGLSSTTISGATRSSAGALFRGDGPGVHSVGTSPTHIATGGAAMYGPAPGMPGLAGMAYATAAMLGLGGDLSVYNPAPAQSSRGLLGPGGDDVTFAAVNPFHRPVHIRAPGGHGASPFGGRLTRQVSDKGLDLDEDLEDLPDDDGADGLGLESDDDDNSMASDLLDDLPDEDESDDDDETGYGGGRGMGGFGSFARGKSNPLSSSTPAAGAGRGWGGASGFGFGRRTATTSSTAKPVTSLASPGGFGRKPGTSAVTAVTVRQPMILGGTGATAQGNNNNKSGTQASGTTSSGMVSPAGFGRRTGTGGAAGTSNGASVAINVTAAAPTASATSTSTSTASSSVTPKPGGAGGFGARKTADGATATAAAAATATARPNPATTPAPAPVAAVVSNNEDPADDSDDDGAGSSRGSATGAGGGGGFGRRAATSKPSHAAKATKDGANNDNKKDEEDEDGLADDDL